MPEGDLNAALMLGASRLGHRLWRNNNGVAFHKDGSVVRYGIPGPGGADLIGLTRRLIRPEDVGRELAIFTAVEAKTGLKRPRQEQQDFLDAVNRLGGLGLWGRDADELLAELVTREPGGA